MVQSALSTRQMYYALGRDGRTDPDFSLVFDQEIVRIPMRDGIELHTEIYRPVDQSGDLPIILTRTPYGLNQTPNGYTALLRMYPDLIEDDYLFVFQDTRGRNASDGEFVTLSPMREDRTEEGATDESTDAYDTIEWLVTNVEQNNGRVGTLGISYGGFLTTRALVDPHPALKAASPQATCADMFIGDDWHHNGAFRLEYAFGWISAMEADLIRGEPLGSYDNYESFLELGPLSNINKNILHGQAPSWNAFTEHPNLDDYWLYGMCGVLPHIQPVTVPTLNVTGWYDAEDFYGPIEVYKKYEATDEKDLNHLVLGPWYHGGWSFGPGRRLGAIDFESNTAEWYRNEIQAPWFAYWLKDEGEIDLPEVWAFRTGANTWESFDSWPPREGIERRSLYLRADGGLSFDPPTEIGDEAVDRYISDPDNPVPFRKRPIGYDGWPEWQAEDQRLAHGRPDVLTYTSQVLEEDLTITGEPIANLFAATTGTDSDWIVKLIDVYPQRYEPEPAMSGFQFLAAAEVFRGRYRTSFESPEPLAAGQVLPYEVNLRSRNHTFKAGHQIMVQIQSTWFPLIDRNPQTFVDSIYEAVAEDFETATQSVYRSTEFPSHLSLPVREP